MHGRADQLLILNHCSLRGSETDFADKLCMYQMSLAREWIARLFPRVNK